ncbi:MAG: chemotaxis protein CheD [Anaerolineae bacterium]|nr:chemotaxis protein CheD [Anaerolineae bacterium]
MFQRTVPIGSIVVSKTPGDVLVAYGLGSCVAVCLYDPVAKVGGMLHALLPSDLADHSSGNHLSPKFVDQGIQLLLDELERYGAKKRRLIAQLCGGAQVLQANGFDHMNIGSRNVDVAEAMLSQEGIRVAAQDTGGSSGRTVRLFIADGRVVVKDLVRGERILFQGA